MAIGYGNPIFPDGNLVVSAMFFLVPLLFLIGVWLLLRGIMCWYFKINKIVSLLEEQNRLMTRLVSNLQRGGATSDGPSGTAVTEPSAADGSSEGAASGR